MGAMGASVAALGKVAWAVVAWAAVVTWAAVGVAEVESEPAAAAAAVVRAGAAIALETDHAPAAAFAARAACAHLVTSCDSWVWFRWHCQWQPWLSHGPPEGRCLQSRKEISPAHCLKMLRPLKPCASCTAECACGIGGGGGHWGIWVCWPATAWLRPHFKPRCLHIDAHVILCSMGSCLQGRMWEGRPGRKCCKLAVKNAHSHLSRYTHTWKHR